ncbi:MAG: hypothetical protein ACTIJ9_11090 [Aequorivita sp.]
MKPIYFLILIILYPFLMTGQIDPVESSEDEIIVEIEDTAEEAAGVEYTKDAQVIDYFEETYSVKQDTLYIPSGKMYVFLIDVHEDYDNGAQVRGGFQDTEEKELRRNFPEHHFEIIKLNAHIFVLFENNKHLEMSEKTDSFQSFVFWSGKLQDDPQVMDGTTNATEFISTQLGLHKESSYVVNGRKFKQDLDNIPLTKDNFTENSKKLLHEFLSTVFTVPFPDEDGENANLLKLPPAKVKTIVASISQGNNSKLKFQALTLNEQGQPVQLDMYDDMEQPQSQVKFVYDKGVLRKILSDWKQDVLVNYNDDKIIFLNDVGDANETLIYSLDQGELVFKKYTIMKNEIYETENSFTEVKYENGCKIQYIQNELWKKVCNSDATSFPYTHTYTSYQDGEVMQYKKLQITKKNDRTFEKHYSQAENADENDVYALNAIYQFNDQDLLESYTMIRGNNKNVISLDYTFYD